MIGVIVVTSVGEGWQPQMLLFQHNGHFLFSSPAGQEANRRLACESMSARRRRVARPGFTTKPAFQKAALGQMRQPCFAIAATGFGA